MVDCVAGLLVVVLCVVDVDTEVLIVNFVVVWGVDFVVVMGVDFVVIMGVDFVVVLGVDVDSVVVLCVVVLWLVVGGESVVV